MRRTNNGNSSSNGTSRNRRRPGKLNSETNLIVAQIVCLQCFQYFVLAFFFQVNNVLYGTSVTLDRIFTDEYVKVWHVAGWPDTVAILTASIAGSVLLAVIVEKSKKCLDFCVTQFCLHLLFTCLFHKFPTHLEWWMVHVASTIVMVLLAEYLCSRKELDEIPLLQL